MEYKSKSGGIDLFKFAAALLVVAIHIDPLSSYSEYSNYILCRVIARVAVPFFFIVSGYFFALKLSDDKKNKEVLYAFIKKIGWLYLVASIMYLPLNIYKGDFTNPFTLLEGIKSIVFNGTFYHLWYLPALILGMSIVYGLKQKLSTRLVFIICIVLYIIGLFGDSYFGFTQEVPIVSGLYEGIFSVCDYTRNGIFFAPLFIAMGMSFTKLDKSNNKKDRMLLMVFGTLLLIEVLCLKRYEVQRHDSMTIFLVPTVYYLFKLCMEINCKERKSLRLISHWIYILHPMMIVVIRMLGKAFNITYLIVDNSLMNYIGVVVLSLVGSVVMLFLSKKKKKLSN
ncbi:acyltransferase family protein [Cellulosilyticum lentocellum]|uniref:Acyltransferase 3 n=1 Tax=Cellulosilyticum lentocellum (strain ATCC 49066 / DSM 5427 / NCIMB 11756 / RHM5) TaxID=642492 RepID=F2JJV7_CELLD|nr:acyltransferase [Cellulosilyticum lentocellum]ADZ83239.1 acyltransferase 3 [Cellulosilyticum lentocellum DSM 5427]